MNISAELAQRDADAQLLFEELNVTVNEVIGAAIAFVNQGIMHVDRFHIGHSFLYTSDVGIIFPKGID